MIERLPTLRDKHKAQGKKENLARTNNLKKVREAKEKKRLEKAKSKTVKRSTKRKTTTKKSGRIKSKSNKKK